MKSVESRLREAEKRQKWLLDKLAHVRGEVMTYEMELEKLKLDIETLKELIEDAA